MTLYLEERLRSLCETQQLEYHIRLERIKRSVGKIWQEPRLLWFTDHGVEHSKRIIDLLGQALLHLQTTSQALNAHELYVLLAACYLHDIGMQNFRAEDGRGMEDFTSEDYDFIRDDHPRCSAEWILARALSGNRDEFRIDLDDEPEFTRAIALVSRGHGSKFFEATVIELNTRPPTPGGTVIRGDLLTALLMIGDELDLREERARIPKDMSLSSVSLLHNYVHHYITNVKILQGAVGKERQIHLVFEYPADSSRYSDQIKYWVVGKLQRQLRRTAEIVEQGTDGELCWSEFIRVEEHIDKYHQRRPLPTEAESELRRQTAATETINYEDAVKTIDDLIAGTLEYGVVCLVSEHEQAMVQIVNLLKAACETKNRTVLEWSLQNEPYSGRDLLLKLRQKLMPNRAASAEEGSLSRELDQFIEDLKTLNCSQPWMVLFLNLDAAEAGTIDWVSKELIKRLSDGTMPLQFVISCRQLPVQFQAEDGGWKMIKLGELEPRHIAAHLLRFHGFTLQAANTKAQEIYGTSAGGKPEGVIFAVRWLRDRGMESANV